MAQHLLLDKEQFAPSVHCGYYSCFQKITYLLSEYYPDALKTIEEDGAGQKKGNLHNKTIQLFRKIHETVFDRAEAREVGRDLNDLKALRIKADYKNMKLHKKRQEKQESGY